MTGKKKTPKVPGFMRTVLAANVKKLMDLHYRESRNRPKALATDAGVSLSTVQRILAADVGASLDNIESIAECFGGMSAYQLLIPALDVDNPQVVQGASAEEKKLYRQWKRGAESGKYPQLQETLRKPEATSHAKRE